MIFIGKKIMQTYVLAWNRGGSVGVFTFGDARISNYERHEVIGRLGEQRLDVTRTKVQALALGLRMIVHEGVDPLAAHDALMDIDIIADELD